MTDTKIWPRPLYMATATDAIVKGDVAEMTSLLAQTEDLIAAYGDVPMLRDMLKVEIAKAKTKAA